MGVLKNGTISGTLPSNDKAFAVHYPGYPFSIERAIETLGGNDGIIKVRTEKSSKLELYFRPEDSCSHPAYGRLQPCNKFVLKISRKKTNDMNVKNLSGVPEEFLHFKQNNNSSNIDETVEPFVQCETKPCQESSEVNERLEKLDEEALLADIIVQVTEGYHFSGMVDYQYVLAIHADNSRRKRKVWDADLPRFEEVGLPDIDQEDLMMLVPPLFSIKDQPETIVLKPSTDLRLKRKQVVQQRWEMEIEKSLAIDFNIKDIPKKVNWEEFTPRDSDRWMWQMAVCDLFDQRPIWVKDSLIEHLSSTKGLNVGNMLRRVLFIAAYYFSNGPFLRFWIKRGYDPRKDPESRIFQRTDFRVPPSLRSFCDTNMTNGSKNLWADICSFKVFPFKCQVSLQLFELEDDYIQQEIRKPGNQRSCSLQTGWFSSNVIDCLRLRVAQRFLSVYPEAGAESILKSVSRRFERCKKLPINLKDLKVDKEKPASEDAQKENKEPDDEVEDEEVIEDEPEDDNLGEYLDTDDAFDMGVDVDQEVNFSLHPDSYMEHENISKDYLQELFGSFPFSVSRGDGMQDAADPFDGEYQIYEQYSDNDDSDDEF